MPVVTRQHFTTPQWCADGGGQLAPDAFDKFLHYVFASRSPRQAPDRRGRPLTAWQPGRTGERGRSV